MTRRRNYIPALSAFWKLRFPDRPPKVDFADEVIVAVDFIMHQIDPSGKKAVLLPPMPAENYVPDSRVKPTGSKGAGSE